MDDVEPTTGETYTALSGYSGNAEKQFTTEKLNWRIWNIDEENNTLTLVADGLTSTKLVLSNAQGYNNGVGILNGICKTCYSNTEIGANGRDLNFEDVQFARTTKIVGSRINSGYRHFPNIHQYEEYSGVHGNLIENGESSIGVKALGSSEQRTFFPSVEYNSTGLIGSSYSTDNLQSVAFDQSSYYFGSADGWIDPKYLSMTFEDRHFV